MIYQVIFILIFSFIITNIYSAPKLTPFKLKKVDGKDNSETSTDYRVQSQKIKLAENNQYEIGLTAGYPIILGYLSGKTQFLFPSLSLYFRHNLSESKHWFLEYAIGYITYKSQFSTDNIPELIVKGDIQDHAYPITISILYKVNIVKGLYLTPKLGLGVMPIYTDVNVANYSSGWSTKIIAQPALYLTYNVLSGFTVGLGGQFIMSQSTDEAIFSNLDFYLMPSLSLSYEF